jgi:hypothetical protein
MATHLSHSGNIFSGIDVMSISQGHRYLDLCKSRIRKFVNLTSVTTNGLDTDGNLQVLFMFNPVKDGGSGVRKVTSWADISSICEANGINSADVKFTEEVLNELESTWGAAS